MQVGINSFAAAHDDASLSVSPSERLRRLLEQIERADQLGLDVLRVGEHHRREFLDSAPVVILANESEAGHIEESKELSHSENEASEEAEHEENR